MIKKYDKYKDSNRYFGCIPEHWTVSRLGFHIDTIVPQRDKPKRFCGDIPWIRIEDFNGKYISDTKSGQYVNEEIVEETGLRVFPVNTVLCSCSCSMGVTAIVKTPLVSNQTFIGLVPNVEISSEFLYYYMQTAKDELTANSVGAIQLYSSKDDFKQLRIPLPSISEQYSIIEFLDYSTSQIDTLIEKKEQLIEKLKAKRQAIINEAVTKGLNPDAPMKDSGVEWLGKIPEHWEVKRTKFLLDENFGIKIGPFGSALKLDTLVESGIKVYGQGNVIKGDFELGTRYLPEKRFEGEFKQYEILPNDVLVTMMGTTGKSCVFSNNYKKGILDSHLLRLRFDSSKINPYLYSTILEKSAYVFHQIQLRSRGSIMSGLNSSIIKDLFIVIPPYKEQAILLKYLEDVNDNIDSLIEKCKLAITKLKQYRQSLISEAVTGKIDLRDWNKDTDKL